MRDIGDIKYRDTEWKGHGFEGHWIGYGIWNLGTWIERDIKDIKYRDIDWKGCEFEGHGIVSGTWNIGTNRRKGDQVEGHQGLQFKGHGMKGTLNQGTYGMKGMFIWGTWNWLREIKYRDMELKWCEFEGHWGTSNIGHGMKGM